MWKTGLGVIVSILVILAANVIFESLDHPLPDIEYGVTFSPRYAKYLQLDWQKVYLQILDDLQVKYLRLPSYWDILEPQQGRYNFSELDFMLDRANKKGTKVILVLGARQPRWPECQMPGWAKSLSVSDRQQQILGFIKTVVLKYKAYPSVWAWQVENEPFAFWFGENCDPPDGKFLQKEVNLVKGLDGRLVMVTDSGEWSNWIVTMQSADILGVSLYKKAYNQLLAAYITYPFPTWMYSVKASLVKKLFAPKNEKTIISELQSEPWVQEGIPDIPVAEQLKLFTVQDFKNNIEFAKKTGFDKQYLWGVEWWYYIATHDHPEYLKYAQTLFR